MFKMEAFILEYFPISTKYDSVDQAKEFAGDHQEI